MRCWAHVTRGENEEAGRPSRYIMGPLFYLCDSNVQANAQTQSPIVDFMIFMLDGSCLVGCAYLLSNGVQENQFQITLILIPIRSANREPRLGLARPDQVSHDANYYFCPLLSFSCDGLHGVLLENRIPMRRLCVIVCVCYGRASSDKRSGYMRWVSCVLRVCVCVHYTWI